jgi:parallel beta-helix repeat protein
MLKHVLAIGMVLALVLMAFAAVPLNMGAEESEPEVLWSSEEPTESLGGHYEPCEVEDLGTVYINSVGDIVPLSAPISKVGDIYTLTGNINDNIVIQKSGITLDGDGYTVKGTWAIGVFAVYGNGLTDVTIMDLIVKEFFVGIRLDYTSDSTITGNTVSDITRGGIVLWGDTATDNTVSKNSISKCGWPIVLVYGAHHNIISDNTVFDNNHGIDIDLDTHSNTISGNTITNNDWYGIYLYDSGSNTLTKNIMINCGILIFADQLANWNTHTIDTSNKVNGKPVYYWKDKTSGTIPSGAGQVLLANCKNVKVKNQDLSDCSAGIELGFSSNCKIFKNNIASTDSYGILLESSTGNYKISQNTVSGTGTNWGIYLCRSDDNRVHRNIVSDSDTGIRTYNGYNNEISNNEASESSFGIRIYYDGDNTVCNNDVSENTIGIQTYYSDGNIINHNKATDNVRNGIVLYVSVGNTLMFNKATGNGFVDEYGYGIYVYYSHGNMVTCNSLKNNYLDGIRLYRSNNNKVILNKASDNDRSGIIADSGEGNKITMNLVMSNDMDGIYVVSSSDIIVKGNVVMKNGANGIKVEHSDKVEVKCNIVKCNGDYDLYWDENGDVTWEKNSYKTKNW